MWKHKFILLLGVVLYAIGGTLQYYFYSDDYSVLYSVQRNKMLGYPYDGEYLAIFKPLYSIFGLHALGYFALGVITYFFAILSVYALIRTLTKHRTIAYLSSLLFATGYVGIEQYNMMFSITNNLSIIGIAGVLISYFLWLEQRRCRYYVISLGIYFLLLMLFQHRTFTLVLFVPTVELFFGLNTRKPFHIRKIIYSLARLLPFYFIARCSGIFGHGSIATFGTNTLIAYTRPAMLGEFFAIFGRMILPNPILRKIGLEAGPLVHTGFGVAFIVLSVLLAVILWFKKSKRHIGILLLFDLALILEGYVGFFLLSPSFSSGGAVNRYLPISFIGFSAFFVLFFWALGTVLRMQRTMWYRIFCVALFIVYGIAFMTASHEYVSARVRDQGKPAVKFIAQLKSVIPSFPRHATIYIDSAEYYPAIPRLGNILSNATFPYEVTFAVIYNIPMDRIRFTQSFDEYVRWYQHPRNPDEEFYSFYYNGLDLRDTTKDIIRSLQSDKVQVLTSSMPAKEVLNKKDVIIVNTSEVPSLGKQQLELTLKISPLDESQFAYPYFFGNPTETQKKEKRNFFDNTQIDRSAVFSYLVARKEYYNTVQVTGTDSQKDYPHTLMVDNRLDTYWVDAANLWELRPEYKLSFVVDLGSVKQISRVLWIPIQNREANVYTISVSQDGLDWHPMNIQSSYRVYDDMTLVSDVFTATPARYIKYEIEQTRNGWPPGIRELEVVEDTYKSIDPLLAWRIGSTPFEYIQNREELVQTYDYVARYGVVRILSKTNKEDVLDNKYFISMPVFVDGQTHTYILSVPSRGTSLEKIGIELVYPAEIFVEKIRILQQKMVVTP